MPKKTAGQLPAPYTPEQAEAARRWKRGMEAMNALEIEELRRTPIEIKLRQLEAMMNSVDEMGFRAGLEMGLEEVRSRWERLRRAFQAQT